LTDRADDLAVCGTAALLEVGRVVRPHGLRGDVVVELVTNRQERVAPGAELHGGDATLRISMSLRVSMSRPLHGRDAPAGRHGERWVVRFAGVSGREEAEELRDTVLFAAALDDDDALWVHDLIGTTVVDPVGEVLGSVAAVQANPASDLLVLDGGALVPLVFVVGRRPGQVTVEAPPGLLDL